MEEREQLGLISIFDAFILCVRHRWLIARAASLFFLLGVGYLVLARPKYTAVVTILPPQQQTSSLLAQIGSAAGAGGAAASPASLGFKSSTDLYVSLLRSRTVEDAMIERYGLRREYAAERQSDARRILDKRVTIDGSGKDGLIHLSLEDRSPARAQELANGWIEQYRRFMQGLAIGEAAQRRLFFETQLQREKTELAAAEEALKKMQQSSGVIQIDGQTRLMIETTAGLRAQIAAKEVQEKSIESYAAAGNPELIAARNELDTLRRQLNELSGGRRAEGIGGLDAGSAVAQVNLDYIRALREVKYHETLFQILANQYELARMDESKEGSLFQTIDTAALPDRPSTPGRLLTVAACTFAGALLGLLLGSLRDLTHAVRATSAFSRRLARLRAAMWAGDRVSAHKRAERELVDR